MCTIKVLIRPTNPYLLKLLCQSHRIHDHKIFKWPAEGTDSVKNIGPRCWKLYGNSFKIPLIVGALHSKSYSRQKDRTRVEFHWPGTWHLSKTGDRKANSKTINVFVISGVHIVRMVRISRDIFDHDRCQKVMLIVLSTRQSASNSSSFKLIAWRNEIRVSCHIRDYDENWLYSFRTV